MWSYVRKSGSVSYSERYKDPLSAKTKTATVTLKPTGHKKNDRRAAEAALKRIIDGVSAKESLPGDITLEALADKYIVWQRQRHKVQTAEGAKRKIGKICDLLGRDTIVSRLTASYVSERLGNVPSAYNERLTRFKAMMRWAYQSDLVSDVSYLDKITRMPDQTVKEKDMEKYLDHDEIRLLLDSMDIPLWKMLTEFLILTGCRIGEAIALEDSDVDLTAGSIQITKTFSLVTHEISTAKTATSIRSISIQPELADLCRKISEDKYRRGDEFAFKTKHFFCDDEGHRINYDAYRMYFERRMMSAVGRKLTPHALRHTHTAMLAEAGVPLETISRRLGHSDSEITRQVYMHVTNKMREKDREIVNRVKILT